MRAAGANTTANAAAAPALPDLARIKGVLFDIDGTLTNSDPLHLLAFQEILSASGFNGGAPIDEEFFRTRISGRHNPEIAADLFPDWSEAARVQMYETKEARFRELAAAALTPMPGLHEFLAWTTAQGLRRVAVTNAPGANARMMLAGLTLEPFFEALVLGEECARAKPHPDPYLRGLEILGLGPRDAIAIEDSPSGLRAAVAAGIPTIGITSTQSAEALLEAGACAVVADFHELLALVPASSGGGGGGGVGGAAAAAAQAAGVA